MNGGAYGGDFAGVLERALVATADGSGWLTPAELGLSYRHSELRHGQVVAARRAAAAAAAAGRDQGRGARAQRAPQGGAADEPAHLRQRLQESRARAERGPDARGVRPQGPSQRRSPDLPEARELHRERRRRHDRGRRSPSWPRRGAARTSSSASASSTRSSFSASSSCPSCRKVRTGAENRRMPARARLARSIARAEAAPLPSATEPPAGASAGVARAASHRRGARSRSASACSPSRSADTCSRASRRSSRSTGSRYGAAPRRSRSQVDAALASLVGRPLVGLDGSAVLRTVDALPTVVSASYDRAFPHTLRITVVPERPAAVLRRGADSWLVSTRGRVMERLASDALSRSCRGSGSRRRRRCRPARSSRRPAPPRPRTPPASRVRSALASTRSSYTGGSLVFHLRSGVELLLGDGGDIKLKLAVAEHVLAMLPSGSTYLDVSNPRPAGVRGSGRRPRSYCKALVEVESRTFDLQLTPRLGARTLRRVVAEVSPNPLLKVQVRSS